MPGTAPDLAVVTDGFCPDNLLAAGLRHNLSSQRRTGYQDQGLFEIPSLGLATGMQRSSMRTDMHACHALCFGASDEKRESRESLGVQCQTLLQCRLGRPLQPSAACKSSKAAKGGWKRECQASSSQRGYAFSGPRENDCLQHFNPAHDIQVPAHKLLERGRQRRVSAKLGYLGGVEEISGSPSVISKPGHAPQKIALRV